MMTEIEQQKGRKKEREIEIRHLEIPIWNFHSAQQTASGAQRQCLQCLVGTMPSFKMLPLHTSQMANTECGFDNRILNVLMKKAVFSLCAKQECD